MEETVISSLLSAKKTAGTDGEIIESLEVILNKIDKEFDFNS